METTFVELEGENDLSDEDKVLLEQARKATKEAYAPYSSFHVGAALRTKHGAVVRGSNFENASYPLCLCAERSAIAAARSAYGSPKIDCMAITASTDKAELSNPVTPCGACRQVLFEVEQIQGSPLKLILEGKNGKIWVLKTVSDLVPLAFDGTFLR
ncbi:MAG: cytidine deaminase [Saprospiraceae bacterium]|nr:cytidine deaminase [Saprospiraceae bacterium]